MSTAQHLRQRTPYCWANGGGKIEDHCPLPPLIKQLRAETDTVVQDAIRRQIEGIIAACDAQYEGAITATVEKGIIEEALHGQEHALSCKARSRF